MIEVTLSCPAAAEAFARHWNYGAEEWEQIAATRQSVQCDDSDLSENVAANVRQWLERAARDFSAGFTAGWLGALADPAGEEK